jgi:hypothetical protein
MAQPARRRIKRYGWIPDLPDHRDRIFAAPPTTLGALPPRADLRAGCPPAYDQGNSAAAPRRRSPGRCNSTRRSRRRQTSSRPRAYSSTTTSASSRGRTTRTLARCSVTASRACRSRGAPHEKLWPYVISRFRTKPSPPAFKDGARHEAILYQRLLQLIDQLKACLRTATRSWSGFPCMRASRAATSRRAGVCPCPALANPCWVATAVVAVGYDEPQRRFIIRNSWGTSWGMRGYGTMPYDYLLDDGLSADVWTIRMVE